MKTSPAISSPQLNNPPGNFRNLKSKFIRNATATALLLIAFLTCSSTQAQRFWLTTYEFPYGAKTGITMTTGNCLFVGLTNGVIMSCDEGTHFERVLKTTAIFSIFSTREGKVLAGGAGKIFITDTSGAKWDSVTIGSVYPVIQFAENSKGDLFAISSGYDTIQDNYAGDGVFLSGDKGMNWTQHISGLGSYTSCEKITIDRNDRLYVASADKYNTGAGGLFISDDNGLQWKHIEVAIDGKNVISNNLKIGNTFGLTISPADSLNFSFSGIAGNVAVDLNIRKSISDVDKNIFWKTYPVFNSNLWWDDRTLFDIHYAKNGDWYSSNRGTINSGGTYFLKNNGATWTKVDYGLGLTISGARDAQIFAENQAGKIFMVQLLDERVYWTDASILTATQPTPEASNRLSLYPNPAKKGETIVVGGLETEKGCNLNIFDSLGRKVRSINATADNQKLTAPLIPGFYILQAQGRQIRESLRFIVE